MSGGSPAGPGVPGRGGPLGGDTPGGGKVLLLAHPAGHSLSPAMHAAAFAAVGIEAEYEAVDVPPEELLSVLGSLRSAHYLGANVTVPHKEAVFAAVDELLPAARAVGAVNTVVNAAGRLVGDNTDGRGFVRALGEVGVAEGDLAGERAVVLGAGGAARSVVHALLSAGADVVVANRSPERAERLVAQLRATSGGPAASVATDARAALTGAALLVNTTSVGMLGGPDPSGLPLLAPADLDALPGTARVVDLVYRPAVTPLLAAASERGLATQSGVAMLVWQGVLSFVAWTGVEPPPAVMRRAVLTALG